MSEVKTSPLRFFVCETCNDETERAMVDMRYHLRTVHKLNKLEGTREFVMHICRRPRHVSVYRWNIGGVILTEHNS